MVNKELYEYIYKFANDKNPNTSVNALYNILNKNGIKSITELALTPIDRIKGFKGVGDVKFKIFVDIKKSISNCHREYVRNTGCHREYAKNTETSVVSNGLETVEQSPVIPESDLGFKVLYLKDIRDIKESQLNEVIFKQLKSISIAELTSKYVIFLQISQK